MSASVRTAQATTDFVDAATLEVATIQALELDADRSEARLRSWPVALGVVGIAACGLALAAWRAPDPVFGDLSPGAFAVLVLSASCGFLLAAGAHAWLGPRHAVTSLTAELDRLLRVLALLGCMVLSGAAALPFLFIDIGLGFMWRPRSRRWWYRTLVLNLVAHGLALAGCLATGRTGDAIVVVLALVGNFVAQTMTAGPTWSATRSRVERDLLEQTLLASEVAQVRERMARELHDGVGAEITALFLQLRGHAERVPQAATLAASAQLALEELRTVVLMLSGERGTLGELAKLLDATCRRLCGATVDCERVQLEQGPGETLAAPVAFAAVRALQPLVQSLAGLPGVRRLRLRVSLGEALSVTVEASPAQVVAVEGTGGAAEARARAAASFGSVEAQASGEAVRLVLTLPRSQVPSEAQGAGAPSA
ncbi:MAG: hypothetical protein K1X89_08465 [Myxococcaceae bacterium]|nr:hypothetical protein [Myxococcaceae bacterium]